MLGSNKLKELLKASPPILSPYCGKKIEGSGLEVRVSCLMEGYRSAFLGVKDKNVSPGRITAPEWDEKRGIHVWRLWPNRFYAIETIETIYMPKDLSGIITPRNTLNFAGVQLLCGEIAPGFVGTLQFGIVPLIEDFVLEEKSRVAMIRFCRLEDQDPADCYDGNYQMKPKHTNGCDVEHIAGVTNSRLE